MTFSLQITLLLKKEVLKLIFTGLVRHMQMEVDSMPGAPEC